MCFMIPVLRALYAKCQKAFLTQPHTTIYHAMESIVTNTISTSHDQQVGWVESCGVQNGFPVF